MALDLTGLSPVFLTLAPASVPISLNTVSNSSAISVSVLPLENSPLVLKSTTPFIAPSGLTEM